jgi:hypothetical protein
MKGEIKMTHSGACQTYIEQEIEERWTAGKKPDTIDKELRAEIQKLFEIEIRPGTIKKRVQRWVKRKEEGTFVPTANPVPVGSPCTEVEDKAAKPAPGRPKKHQPPKAEAPPPKAPREPAPVCITLLSGQGKRIVDQLNLWGQDDPGFMAECLEILNWFKGQPKLRELLIANCPVCGNKRAEEEAPPEVAPELSHLTQETQRAEAVQN